MRHHDTLVIPYGTSDTAIAFASVPIPDLLGRMRHTAAIDGKTGNGPDGV